jgi:hypothetical protein
MTRSFPSRIRAGFGACLLALPLMASARTHAACLEILSPSVNFGDAWIGKEMRGYLQVRNACERGIAIPKITVSKPVFRVATPLPVSLPGLASTWLDFRLTPDSAGPVSGTACLFSKPGTRPACVSLSGVGIVPPIMSVSPTSVQLTLAAGTNGTTSFQIGNSGGDRLEAIVDFTGQFPRPAAGWKVAFLQTPSTAGYGQFIDMVRSLPNVDTLDVFDGSAGIPTLAYLNGFDVVMVESGLDAGNWADAAATGDTLGAYIQSGGKMIYFARAFAETPNHLYGLIRNFLPIQGRQLGGAGHSGTLASHPINAGVNSYWTTIAMQIASVPDNASVSLGSYADWPGSLTGADHVMYPVTLLNLTPENERWTGDVPRLVANALDYLGAKAAWMTTNGVYPFPGTDIFTVEAGATRTLEMKVWTYRMAPGTYQGELHLLHSDPAQASPYIIPVTLNVTP